ncbi:MAG: hypothetical protein MI923_02045 [Phycisphaerales bacterium]|nr:hypothetical protein [Phycisphaerales bacterium]
MCQTLDKASESDGQPLALIIEENLLTAWAIENTLSPSYDVLTCTTFEEASKVLQNPRLKAIICGSPVADEDPDALSTLARGSVCRVVVLVSDTGHPTPENVIVLEKPFALEQLACLLAP